MKRIGWKWSSVGALLVTVALVAYPAALRAQQTASVHGHVTNPVGMAVTKGEVRLTQDRSAEEKNRKYPYTFALDANGDYKGTGITPGNYLIIVFLEGHSVDFYDNVNLAANDDKVQNFDMSRKEYIDKMTPEERKQFEEYKKKNADVAAANAKISNLNTMLTQARADTKAGNYDAAITSMQQATTAKPDEAILWVALGDAQLGSADAAAKAAKAAGKPVASDPEITQKYNDAIASYKKATDANAASKKPLPETAAVSYNQLGQAYAKLGNGKDASDAYEQAAKAQPANAGMYYFNEAATLYNAGKVDEAGAAADKAIAADPKRADAYYIKAQSLIPKATVDPKTQKIVAPPGCVEAYQEYLELAPDGPRAEEVKGILNGIGAEVKSSYKAGKKK
ncbi:tetratricopeptide repeat protein [Edaphobacter bradus]|uniref:tetratricopeptide repeat protein n=1 Tax=Edaphobacter bradus TaxID=2259016 RepID=UPI0021E08D86|nr:tetratricopeptide repeat protein [Edaphobacter bradus]